MSKLKTVVVVNDFDYINGGAAKVAINTAELLAKSGIKVYFFSATHNNKEKNSDIQYISTNQEESLKDKNKIRGALNGIYNIKAKKELGKLLDKLDKETTIIHIHGWMKALSSSIFDAINKKGFKCAVTFHDYFLMCPNGGFFDYKSNKICKKNPLSLRCITCNCDSRNYLFKIYRVIRQFVQNKIVKINKKIKYAISISDFSYNILKCGLAEDTIVEKINNPVDIKKYKDRIKAEENSYYLYVGRISKEKGVNLFCKVITELKLKGIVVGDGNQKETLQKEYPNIDFAGWKNKEEVEKIMKNARTLVFPSLWYEAAPLTTLEAQSIGLPCVVSDCSAAIENIRNENNGLIFDINNIKDLLEKIYSTKDNTLLKKLSENSYYEYWKKVTESDKYEQKLLNFFNIILKG